MQKFKFDAKKHHDNSRRRIATSQIKTQRKEVIRFEEKRLQISYKLGLHLILLLYAMEFNHIVIFVNKIKQLLYYAYK